MGPKNEKKIADQSSVSPENVHFQVINGVTFINLTPFPVRFLIKPTNPSDLADIVTLEPSGITLKIFPREEEITQLGYPGINVVFETVEGTRRSEDILDQLRGKFPDALFIGAARVAQAFAGRICSLYPAEGYERVSIENKVYRIDKFRVW